MKKIFLSLLLALAASVTINAVPVYPRPVKLPMPDGTELTIVGHGDEYRHYTTTLDGYTIVRGQDKFFHYAQLADGKLQATDVVAHEVGMRSSTEMSFLSRIDKHVMPVEDKNVAPRLMAPGQTDMPNRVITSTDNYKGLVVLVNFKDRQFRLGDAMRDHVEQMMNTEGWTSYEDEGKTIATTGSVHDYFSDNSYGKFAPKFDVVGPVTINYSCEYPHGSNYMQYILKDVIAAIKGSVDFSQYDADKNGEVDMIYFIFAGYASSNQGNNENYLWPHASNLKYYVSGSYNGVTMGRYACSTELYGWEDRNDTELNGIGTICHEFSHVLGYMDHYDSSNTGHEHPSQWDVMAAGCYNGDLSNCPAGYNAYERYAGGFMTPTLLTKANDNQTFTLNNIQENPEAYYIKTPQNREFFLVENRQKVKWDAALPGHGMLLWRVDSTSTNKWYGNQVNSTDHSYFQLVRANGWKNESSDGQGDAFPGSKSISSITNETSPASMLSYAKKPCDVTIHKIRETNGEISFILLDKDSELNNKKELPEGMLFRETFDECDGKGGNDGLWSTTQVAGGFYPDNDGWTYKTVAGLNQCARFGSGAATRESILTPAITLTADKTCQILLRVAPYATDGQSWTLSVESGDALLQDADQTAEPSTSVTFKMDRNKWNEVLFTVTGSGKQVFKLYGSTTIAKRIVIDELTVYDHIEFTNEPDGINTIEANSTSLNPFTPVFNLNGQRVDDGFRGIVIQNGKKYLRK